MTAKEYEFALKKRDALEIDLRNAYEWVYTIQDKYNEITHQIEDYQRDQAVLDD